MMRATNTDFEAIGRSLDQTIARLERTMSSGISSMAAMSWRDQLVQRRRMVDRLLRNRRIEASQPVVDFSRWFTGDGALYDAVEVLDLLPRRAAM
jgi:hypothetical protein